MEWSLKKVLVVGLGKSGMAAAQVLARLGAKVFACDKALKDEVEIKPLKELGVTVFLGCYPQVEEIHPDLVVTSPGVPLGEPPLKAAREAGIPIWGELELAYRLLPAEAKIVAITGTNGKTTTTALAGQILKDAGYPTVVAGNIGIPLIGEVEKARPGQYFVCEVSSFQLETVDTFHPHVAAILNITPDHLDRHGSFSEYVKTKARLLSLQGPDDFAVLNFDDPPTRSLEKQVKGHLMYFSRQKTLSFGCFIQEGFICLNLGKGVQPLCRVEELALRGLHNLENSLAAAAIGGILGVPPYTLGHTLKTFPGVPHRLEPVAYLEGVLYVNDSKGTNPEATIKALEAYSEPLILIAGGKNKGSDFTPLAQKMLGRVKHLILLGEAAPVIKQAAKEAGLTSIFMVRDLKEAVERAKELARPGDIVLLSPACASWDMFRNYEERGNLFKSLVRSLAEGRR
ncbi:UDP-N-acetylmuramoylalanine--D-glutamate ligase [Thermanaeromonas toyohensis ToBE]|uniref:UDP-N-acetylmuramoylalanine--D-glutamate ligase n=1 Tax=Thermanaeromonas toyohensis ToBE TaxID=698762 RepID=A0A1W1VLX3_9FIRM|nr:UDP-N-acetylmuramoyl-L-alanine--D-glutamate ligase [Thermanaeromonas toyohensis]SMB94328.1 UDP-N-acetylmuramoylalanine--D-glutamate ligase [Thermanaeromonas toyohensis ToBE]